VGHWHGEIWNRRKNGDNFAEWLSINIIYNENGSKRLHVAIFSDITEKKHADELIWKQANYDHLTLLPNRRLFRDRLEQSIRAAHRNGDLLGLLFLDLDRFKEINDEHGHDIGDKLLIEAAVRISSCVREMDTVSRMGGDEFTVILSQITDRNYAGKVASAIIHKLDEPFAIEGMLLRVSASIGIAIFPADGAVAEQLIKNSDKAMYAAKSDGRGKFSYFANST
jgi:diguanylate cyclase (GGDEF)-like protein